ncbi:MAG: adenylate/guanylate cyclase domain-containing protein, partial [Acetobacteraceae bacterium]|nr:adenylate/guanylate cyclase domain-containing protein [Acetobacteraceae bacterium]
MIRARALTHRIIGFGTERFPEPVARRLRVVNIAAWLGAVAAGAFAVVQLAGPVEGLWRVGLFNAGLAAGAAATPLLHRFGPTAATLHLVLGGYAAFFGIAAMLGTGTGVQLYYLAFIALALLFLGTERLALCGALTALAVALMLTAVLLLPRDTGRLPAPYMVGHFIGSLVGSAAILFAVMAYALRELRDAEAAARREHERSEALLGNILPAGVAARLKERPGTVIADDHAEASILFADMAGFTARSGDTEPEALVRFLNRVFTDLDRLVERHGLEKVKTTGDAYMVVSGVPTPRPDHAEALAELALAIRAATTGLRDPKGRPVPIRIGIASGPVVAGVIGTRKFFFDVWGDAVNMASRMESTGVEGRIQVDEAAQRRLARDFVLEPRGAVEVKGKGRVPA